MEPKAKPKVMNTPPVKTPYSPSFGVMDWKALNKDDMTVRIYSMSGKTYYAELACNPAINHTSTKSAWDAEMQVKKIIDTLMRDTILDYRPPTQDTQTFEEWLDGLVWDKTPRVKRLFIDFLGVQDDPYYEKLAELWMIAAVARAKFPGIVWNYLPIIIGKQGIGKSSFLRALFGSWRVANYTGDSTFSTDCYIARNCIEISEPVLTPSIRQFITNTTDHFISAKSKKSVVQKQYVCVQTTNDLSLPVESYDSDYLWPLYAKADPIETNLVHALRDSLWAEAVILYNAAMQFETRGTGEPARRAHPDECLKAMVALLPKPPTA